MSNILDASEFRSTIGALDEAFTKITRDMPHSSHLELKLDDGTLEHSLIISVINQGKTSTELDVDAVSDIIEPELVCTIQ